MSIYEDLHLKNVINASGRMTKLGVSCISEEVKQAMNEAAQHYVVMDELYAAAGNAIARYIGCEDVCVTASASSGIALTIASLLCGHQLSKVQHFTQTAAQSKRREVILLKGHNVDFGAPIDLMIETGGGIVKEVGYANRSSMEDIREAINEHTLAILYVKSHHCVQKNMVSVQEVIQIAKEYHIPCIIDAAAEEDLSCYIQAGADFVCYSGAKAISGPTSGFVACQKEEAAKAMRLQYYGIGRVMKVGKEAVAGLVKAVEGYTKQQGYIPLVTNQELQDFATAVQHIPGLHTELISDEAGRPIQRCRVYVEAAYGKTALQVVKGLQQYTTPIYVRDYHANEGSFDIDPRPLNGKGDLAIIIEALRKKGGHV